LPTDKIKSEYLF